MTTRPGKELANDLEYVDVTATADTEEALDVSSVLRAAGRLLERHAGNIKVRGEISDWQKSGSRHRYGVLRDPSGQLPVVMFSRDAARLEEEPTRGEEILAHGRLAIHPGQGRFQMVIRAIESLDASGCAEVARAALIEMLRMEGLLGPGRKRRIPAHLGSLGIVTSVDSAAVQDIVAGVERRAPWVRILVAHADVGGVLAATSIASAVTRLANSEVPLMIVARGGGTVADLAPFDTEIVARAIARSRIPVITAIGHERHTTIADLVADARASTPAAAAEVATPDIAAVLGRIGQLRESSSCAIARAFAGTRRTVVAARSALYSYGRQAVVTAGRQAGGPRIDALRRASMKQLELSSLRLEGARRSLSTALTRVFSERASRLQMSAVELGAASPARRLFAGYAVLETEGVAPVRSIIELPAGEEFTAYMADGHVRAMVISVHR